jgi:hypothetical protein
MSASCQVEPCYCHHTESSESLSVKAARLADCLEEEIGSFLVASDQNLGDIELGLEEHGKELLRAAAQKAAQRKADLTPPVCPDCHSALSRVSQDHQRSFECRFGTITLRRARGYCRKCRKWRFPADAALGLEETAGYSPRVQEMTALLASKMPVSEASAVMEHLTGVKMPRSTLDREARRQGERARQLRRKLDQQACQATPAAVQPEMVLEPYQMIIQMDAWNIREPGPVGPDPTFAASGPGAATLALGLHGHMFSARPSRENGRRAPRHQPAGRCGHARGGRRVASTIACGGHAARFRTGRRSAGHWRRGGLDLASGR